MGPMDGQQFDRMARRLAGSLGRRGALRALLGVAAVGVAGPAALRVRAQAECPDGCRNGETCLNGACVRTCRENIECRSREDACIGGRCVDGVCTQFAARCEAGYVCCGNGRCCPQRCRLDIDCTVADPCVTARCADGVCAFGRREPCVPCDSDAACVETGGTCCGGACVSPCQNGAVLSKGCECVLQTGGGITVISGEAATDDASGGDGEVDIPPTPRPTATPIPTPSPVPNALATATPPPG